MIEGSERDGGEVAVAGPVTKEEVRAAFEAGHLNATAIRAALGNRGSFSTIQKHLVVLRDEARAAAAITGEGDEAEAPKWPEEVRQSFQAAWNSAWAHAQMRVRIALTQAYDKIQALETRLAEHQADAPLALARIDELEGEAERLRQQHSEQLSALALELESERAATAAALAEVKAVDERLTAEHQATLKNAWEAAHAQADALRDAKAQHALEMERALAARALLEQKHEMAMEVLRGEMRAEMRHLVQQVADLRTALGQRQQPAADGQEGG